MSFDVVDHDHFLAYSGLVVSALAYFSTCVAHKLAWIKLLVAMVVAQLAYAVLLQTSDTFSPTPLASGSSVLGLTCVFWVLAQVMFNVLMLGAAFLVVGPVLVHNVVLLTEWLRANVYADTQPWVGAALIALGALLMVLVVHTCRLVERVLLGVFVVAGTLVFFVYLRIAAIELSYHTEQLRCEWVAGGDSNDEGNTTATDTGLDNRLCPLGIIDDVAHAGVFVLLLVFSCVMTYHYHSQRRRRSRPPPGSYQRVQAPPPVASS